SSRPGGGFLFLPFYVCICNQQCRVGTMFESRNTKSPLGDRPYGVPSTEGASSRRSESLSELRVTWSWCRPVPSKSQEGSWRATPEREAPEHGDRRRRQQGRPLQRTPPHRTGPQRRWPEGRESRATPREQPTGPEQPSAATQSACRYSRSLTAKTT